MFTLDTDSGFRDVVFITASYGLGETVVQGAVNPDEFYVYKPALRAGHRPILRRTLGGKAIKMIYARRPTGRQARRQTVDVARSRSHALLHRRRRRGRARAPGADHRGALRLPDGHRVGQGRRAPARSTSCRRGRRPCRAARPHAAALHAEGARRKVLVSGRSIGQRIGAGPARVIRGVKEMARVRARRRAGRRHDRSGLGAGHEARLRDRHQSRRPHLPRGDHRARTRHPGGRRLRRCHAQIAEGQPVTVSCAEGDTGYVYDGLLEFEQPR